MNYQRVIFAGNATDDAQSQTSQNGDVTYTRFDVGVSDAKEQSTYFPVVVFGKQGEAVAEYISKGRQVLVEGRIEVNDKGRFNIIADRVQFGPEPAAKNTQ
jgi:single-strand DNA-binding protein